jgi:hypothetical protein
MPADSIEFALLCSVARPRPDLDKAWELLQKDVDGDVLFSLAARHGVRPQLAIALTELASSSGSHALRRQLEDFQQQHLLRSLTIAGELVTVAAALTEAAIAFAAFKGPVLALQLYGDLSRREYADIDLAVPASQAEPAERVLAAMGYGSSQGDPEFRRTFLWHQRQTELTRNGFDSSIDLHWDFTADPLPFPLAPGEIWSNLSAVEIGGGTIPALAGEELALVLAGHGTKEAWLNLVWVCDFAMLAETRPELDWSKLYQRARRRGSGDSVLLAFLMANRLLDAPMPPVIASLVAGRSRVTRAADSLVSGLRQARPVGAKRPHLQDLLLCDNLRDRVWSGLKLVMMPTPGDYAAMKLPRALWRLYWLTRPFRLAAKAARLI